MVIELKTTAAQPAHLGLCVGAVDASLRDPERDDETIGILIAESRDKAEEASVEFALQLNNQTLAVGTYAGLPDEVKELMPSPHDLSRIAGRILQRGADAG